MCAEKGFVGVDPDNMDANLNNNGLGITAGDVLTFADWLARQAHSAGLAVGLKNNLPLVGEGARGRRARGGGRARGGSGGSGPRPVAAARGRARVFRLRAHAPPAVRRSDASPVRARRRPRCCPMSTSS